MTTVIEVEHIEEKQPNVVAKSVQKLFWFNIGAVATLQDKVSEFANDLVKRGEKAQKERTEQVKKMVEDRRKESRETTKKAEQEIEKRVEKVLHRLSIPTTADVKAINTKLTTLTRKVDELKKTTAHPVAERVSQN
jgi:poly(hydroxyalkanoate) granule-associated protein